MVRDKAPKLGWSDIDLIIIFIDILKRNPMLLSKIQNKTSIDHTIRIDITQISLQDIEEKALLDSCMNSEVINALSMRKDVSIVLYGNHPNFSISVDQEKRAAVCYINNTIYQYRRFMIDIVFSDSDNICSKKYLPRAIRWTFSIVRASLRLFNIYTHPYEYSLPYVKEIFPNFDISILYKLIEIRDSFQEENIDISIFQEIEYFLENYNRIVTKRYHTYA